MAKKQPFQKTLGLTASLNAVHAVIKKLDPAQCNGTHYNLWKLCELLDSNKDQKAIEFLQDIFAWDQDLAKIFLDKMIAIVGIHLMQRRITATREVETSALLLAEQNKSKMLDLLAFDVLKQQAQTLFPQYKAA